MSNFIKLVYHFKDNGLENIKMQVNNINTAILKQCRKQMALDIEEAKKKIPSIKEIEAGEKRPTYKQLRAIADYYNVPDWVFICNELPKQFQFKTHPAFRSLQGQKGIEEYKVRKLIVEVERMRQLILDFREDLEEVVEPYQAIPYSQDPVKMAQEVRNWLGIATNQYLDTTQIREKLEAKGIFVFMTSKYPGWSRFAVEDFRGLAIYKELLPIIIINDSDTKKAQSFSLYHELGHLLAKKDTLDYAKKDNKEEKWCDRFAGNVLMPESEIAELIKNKSFESLADIKPLAKKIKASPYAFAVRLRQLDKISQNKYEELEIEIKKEIARLKKELKEKKTSIRRNRPKEVLYQFGKTYSHAVWQVYHENQIGLHKLCKLFDIKRAQVALDIGDLL